MIARLWPWRKPTSLRDRMLIGMGAVHILAAVLVAWFSYASLSNVLATAKDDQMQMLATSYSQSTRVPVMRNLSATDLIKRGIFLIQIWSSDGVLLSSSVPDVQMPLQQTTGFKIVQTGPRPANEWRVFSSPARPVSTEPTDERQVRVQVVLSTEYLHQIVIDRAIKSMLPIALALPLSFAVLWFLVWSSSRSLHNVAMEVSRQDERNLTELSPTRVPDEIAPLVIAYNTLVARMRKAFTSQGRFVQDAAHELRTPITAISLQLENLRAYVPPGDASERFAQLEGGVARSRHLIEQLLRLSRQESEATLSSSEATDEIDVASVLRESIGQLMVHADRRHIDVGFDGPISAALRAPEAELRSVFDNLIGNAVRYAPERGIVDVRLYRADDHAVVDVIDNGPGIAPEFIDRAFDRFFRVPGNGASGSGLGLAIALVAAERNGLRLELVNRDHGTSGLIARVHLPAQPMFECPERQTLAAAPLPRSRMASPKPRTA